MKSRSPLENKEKPARLAGIKNLKRQAAREKERSRRVEGCSLAKTRKDEKLRQASLDESKCEQTVRDFTSLEAFETTKVLIVDTDFRHLSFYNGVS